MFSSNDSTPGTTQTLSLVGGGEGTQGRESCLIAARGMLSFPFDLSRLTFHGSSIAPHRVSLINNRVSVV